MAMTLVAQELRDSAEAGEHDARVRLETIIRRHVDLVYSAALRRVGDSHLAEDVTQAVFVILARKFKTIRDEDAIGPWLLRTVRYAAANALRMEARRRKHEEAAAKMNSGACSSNPTDVLLWQEIASTLDDAVLKLSAPDRLAIVGRYFQNKPVAQIAAELNLSQVAAHRRLSRAIEKLRQKLSGGAMLSSIDATTLAALLTSHAVRAAPVGLWQSALATASAGAGASTCGIAIAKGAIKMMAWTKAKIVMTVVTISVIGGTGGVMSVQRAMAAAPSATGSRATGGTQAAAAAKKTNKNAPSMETAPPVVVKTVPEAGATDVDPNITEIKVTYSKDMADGSWSWSTWGQENMPKITEKPHYDADKRTCIAPVKLVPGKFYAIWLNSNNFHGFQDQDGNAAVPYLLVFETKK